MRSGGTSGLVARVLATRATTMRLAEPLDVEDWVVQSMPDASPVKWHLAHTSWFFDRFVLRPLGCAPITAQAEPACVHADGYDYLFNSYYESVGARQPRARRGMLVRPTAREVIAYRAAVDARLADLEGSPRLDEVAFALELGRQHEQQHQELLLTDVKHLYSENPTAPAYRKGARDAEHASPVRSIAWQRHDGGLVRIGDDGDGFAFDNERPAHDVFVAPFALASRLVTCGEYLDFIGDGGYRRAELWLSEGWAWAEGRRAPLYWDLDRRTVFTLGGTRDLHGDEPVCHVTYYEADAYARWAGARLPRESEWEVAARRRPAGADGTFADDARFHPVPVRSDAALSMTQMLGDTWEWTSSAYAPYPGYAPLPGAFAEYNGKFMVSQLVLRGGSCATPRDHVRATYRNFFPPAAAWQFTGIRLAKDAA